MSAQPDQAAPPATPRGWPCLGRCVSALQPSRASAASKRRRPFAARFGKGHQATVAAPVFLRSGKQIGLAHQAAAMPRLLEGLCAALAWVCALTSRQIVLPHRPPPLSPSAAPRWPRSSNSRTSLPICSGSPRSSSLRESLPSQSSCRGSAWGQGVSWKPRAALGPPPPAPRSSERTRAGAQSAGEGSPRKPD